MITGTPTVPETLAAVAVLTRAGISDEAIGRAVREWLGRQVLSPNLLATEESGFGGRNPPGGHNPSTPAGLGAASPDSRAYSPISHAEARVEVREPEQQGSNTVNKGSIPLKVRFADGTATNILLPESLLVKVALRFGGDLAARKLARELAKSAPATVKNRSAWVAEALGQKLDPSPVG